MPAAVVPHGCSGGFRHTVQVTHKVLNRLGLQVRVPLQGRVEVSDIRVMVLAVMDLHGLGVDMGRQSIECIRQARKCKSHLEISLS